MRKSLKGVLCMGIAAGIVFANNAAAFAGTWRTGAEPNENKWWYDFDNGTYAENGWQWIDGNQDGVAECYYFDAEGWMLADTTTPDGYTVNADGKWTVNEAVQTKAAETQPTEAAQETQTTQEAQEAPASQPTEAPVQETSGVQTASELAKYSGTYQLTDDPEFLVWVGLDESWQKVSVTVSGSSVTVNGIIGENPMETGTGLSVNLPGTNCAADIKSDGTMVIYHLAAADRVGYKKVN